MADVRKLGRRERVFLAGCIQAVSLADGSIEEQEVREIDALLKKLQFDDYESCLQEFEATVADEGAFYAFAATITDADAQSVILETVYDLSLHEGVPEAEGTSIFARLSDLWDTDNQPDS